MSRIVKFNAQDNYFSFPTWNADGTMGVPSRVTFGYIGDGGVFTRYQSAEFQYCAFDELTQHCEDDYLYLFSRLRRIKCPIHASTINESCASCSQLARVPIRMRAASNPGGVGHSFVKNRFKIEADKDPDDPTGQTIRYIGKCPDRPFIPSLAKDNPFLDRDEYVKSLQNLPDVVRKQLLAGDWSISHDARYKSHWFNRRWSRYGNSYVLGPDGHGPHVQLSNLSRLFFTVDPASSSREGPGDKENWAKIGEHNMSWTVICVWGYTHDGHLLLLYMHRIREEIPQVLDQIRRLNRQWRPNYIVVESAGLGRGVFQLLAMHGLPVRPIHPHTDKVVRATNMMLLAERGRVWLPQQSFNFPWVKEIEDELFVWMGHTLQQDDIVDAFSLAGLDVGVEAVGLIDDLPLGDGGEDTVYSEAPFIIQ